MGGAAHNPITATYFGSTADFSDKPVDMKKVTLRMKGGTYSPDYKSLSGT